MILLYWTFVLLRISLGSSQNLNQGILSHNHENYDYYAIQIPRDTSGNPADLAKEIADEHGYKFVGSVGQLDHYFLLSTPKSLSSLQGRSDALESLQEDDRVEWIQQQIPTKRIFKRMSIPFPLTEEDISGPNNDTLIEARQSLQSQLQITDTGFPDQWHLVIVLKVIKSTDERK